MRMMSILPVSILVFVAVSVSAEPKIVRKELYKASIGAQLISTVDVREIDLKATHDVRPARRVLDDQGGDGRASLATLETANLLRPDDSRGRSRGKRFEGRRWELARRRTLLLFSWRCNEWSAADNTAGETDG